MYTCLQRHCVIFWEVCNGDDDSVHSDLHPDLHPLYNQLRRVLQGSAGSASSVNLARRRVGLRSCTVCMSGGPCLCVMTGKRLKKSTFVQHVTTLKEFQTQTAF